MKEQNNQKQKEVCIIVSNAIQQHLCVKFKYFMLDYEWKKKKKGKGNQNKQKTRFLQTIIPALRSSLSGFLCPLCSYKFFLKFSTLQYLIHHHNHRSHSQTYLQPSEYIYFIEIHMAGRTALYPT